MVLKWELVGESNLWDPYKGNQVGMEELLRRRKSFSIQVLGRGYCSWTELELW